MIVKVMDPAGLTFPGVDYNDKKIDKGKGELMLMKNFPSFINEDSDKQQVRNYLKAISVGNKKVQKPQFHAMISTKFREHSKEELTKIADNVMNEMGYGEQPFIVVFHKDTENNHVHIVSTRVDKSNGKKINDSFEKLKAQKAKTQKVIEFDMIKNAPELTQMVAERKNADETNLYKLELQKLKNYLYDKIDQYPEIAKDITNDMNIVSREIDSVNSISPDEKQILKGDDSDIQLNVNDRDMYEDANRHREEELEKEQEQHKSKGRGR